MAQELKAITAYEANWKAESYGDNGVLVYLKSAADKVIAELKKQIHDYAQGLYVMQARAEKESSHHKYKRCLAMTEMCEARYDEEDAKVNGYGASWEYISKEMKYWERWRQRWLELAEKFKEAK